MSRAAKAVELLSSPREARIKFDFGRGDNNPVVVVSELEFSPTNHIAVVRVKHTDSFDLTSPALPTRDAAVEERGRIFEHAIYILQYASTYKHHGQLVLEGLSFEWVDGALTCVGRIPPANTAPVSRPTLAATPLPTRAAVPVVEGDDDGDGGGGDDDDLVADLVDLTYDELSGTLARLKLETTGLRDLNDTAKTGLSQLEKSNMQIAEALKTSGFVVPPVPLPDGLAYALPASLPPTRVILPDDERVADTGSMAMDDGEEEEDDEAPRYRNMPASGLRPLPADDAEEEEDDDDEPRYRNMAVHAPPMALASRYADAALADGPAKAPMMMAQSALPASSVEPPMVHRAPSAGKRDRATVRVEVESAILEERRQRQQLLQTYHQNEITLARLQAHNRELMRQVALLKSGAQVPRVRVGS